MPFENSFFLRAWFGFDFTNPEIEINKIKTRFILIIIYYCAVYAALLAKRVVLIGGTLDGLVR